MLRAFSKQSRSGGQASVFSHAPASVPEHGRRMQAHRASARPAGARAAHGNQQMLKLMTGGHLQRKLAVNQPGDRFEQEADRMADRVMRTTAHAGADDEPCSDCQSKTVQRQPGPAASPAAGFAPPVVDRALTSPAQSLDSQTRSFMEARLDADFRNVRVHTGTLAAESALAVNALAYTSGRDVVFGKGRYAPQTDRGQRLLAHELTHVVQQSASAGPATIQRAVQEKDFPGGGKVDDVRSGEHLVWNFDIGKTVLKPEHEAQIPRLAAEIKQALTRDATATIDIEGQSSLTGTQARNEVLAQQRAEAVRDALVLEGIDTSRLNVTQVGALESAPDTSQENLARSRAVRISLPAHLLLPAGPSQAPPQTGPCTALSAGTLNVGGGPVSLQQRVPKFLHIQTGSGSATPPAGMEFSGAATLNPPGCGAFLFVQNVIPFREFIYKDHSRNTFQSSNFVLDTSDPYVKPTSPKGPMALFFTNDSPSQPIDQLTEPLINTVEVRDDYRMFLLFQPSGGNRVPLQVGEWSFKALARTDTPNDFEKGNLVLDSSASRVDPKNGTGHFTNELPVTSPNVTGLNTVTNNGGLTGKAPSFAELHRQILDKLKPRAAR